MIPTSFSPASFIGLNPATFVGALAGLAFFLAMFVSAKRADYYAFTAAALVPALAVAGEVVFHLSFVYHPLAYEWGETIIAAGILLILCAFGLFDLDAFEVSRAGWAFNAFVVSAYVLTASSFVQALPTDKLPILLPEIVQTIALLYVPMQWVAVTTGLVALIGAVPWRRVIKVERANDGGPRPLSIVPGSGLPAPEEPRDY